MQTKQTCNVIWFKNNLRIFDHAAFAAAMNDGTPLLALYCWDENTDQQQIWGFPKIDFFRKKFLIESLYELETKLEQLQIPLWICHGNATIAFSELQKHTAIKTVFYQKEWNFEEKNSEIQAKKSFTHLPKFQSFWNQTLFEPHQILALFGNTFPKSFTQFRIEIEKKLSVRTEISFPIRNKNAIHISHLDYSFFKEKIHETKKTAHLNSAFHFKGGENEALNRIDSYFFQTHHIKTYKQTRNGLLGTEYSSKLSAWLANGCISPVTIFHSIKKYENKFGSNESTYWLFFELLWREFFKWTSYYNPNKIFHLKGIGNTKPFIHENKTLIEQWTNGQTRCNFVNANIIELRKTGWMSNRGRQNVASFFCKTLQQDWRIGAAYFESLLIDYDADSNYGNWMYLAGVGNDTRNRIFNTTLQAKNYDPNYTFRNTWLQNFE